MLTQASTKNADEFAAALLIHYSFDLGGYTAQQLIDHWLNDFSANWICSAVIESLYQGRYKAVSVEQILAFWRRRGLASYHFNHEFERLICGNLPPVLSDVPSESLRGAEPQTPIGESDPADRFDNGLDDFVVTASSAEENTVAKVDDPATKSFEKLTQRSDKVTESRRYSPTQSSPHSDSTSPIKHFIPKTDDKGEFYTKLKALSESDRDHLDGGESVSN